MHPTPKNSSRAVLFLCLVFVVCSSSTTLAGEGALAYVGPGAGLGMLGSLLALVAAILIGLLGLLLYPIMLLRKTLRKRGQPKTIPSEQ